MAVFPKTFSLPARRWNQKGPTAPQFTMTQESYIWLRLLLVTPIRCEIAKKQVFSLKAFQSTCSPNSTKLSEKVMLRPR